MKTCYIPKNFHDSTLATIARADEILSDYYRRGYVLTLRQLYYQFVARDLLDNKQSEYKRLGSIINDARLAGLIDWDHMEDRTRDLRELSHWNSPAEIVRGAARSFRFDLWESQEYRPEVWIEKDALVGVIEGPCVDLDVPFFSCRGYTSQSEMYAAAQRFQEWVEVCGQVPIIFHLGDHDPSGIDMTCDIRERLEVFGLYIEVRRLALNSSQIEEYDPPPNPTKLSDARARDYVERHGRSSWELDALDPDVLGDLIRDAVASVRDDDVWEESVSRQERARGILKMVSRRWSEIEERYDTES